MAGSVLILSYLAMYVDMDQQKVSELRNIAEEWWSVKDLNECLIAIKKAWNTHRNGNGKLDAVDKK